MFLHKITLSNFKNYKVAEIAFNKPITCFIGPNGVGKTNLLDAIYYLCLCKSYFNASDNYNINHNERYLVLKGTFELNNEQVNVRGTVQKDKDRKKDFYWNDLRYEKLADHIGKLPVVIITPDDSVLITGGSEERRKFLDALIAQTDRNYLQQLQQYNRILNQRNALLKQFAEQGYFDKSMVEVYDMSLVPLGLAINAKRAEIIEQFEPYFQHYYKAISNDKEDVILTYDSKLNHFAFDDLLNDSLERDRVLKYTTTGIHKDDLRFDMDEQKVKRFSSQGQQKSFLIALKLAEYTLLNELKGKAPILLLDDIFDKLDATRSANLLQFLRENDFGQTFITDTRRDRIEEAFAHNLENVAIFEIDNGEITTL